MFISLYNNVNICVDHSLEIFNTGMYVFSYMRQQLAKKKKTTELFGSTAKTAFTLINSMTKTFVSLFHT